MGTVLTYVPMLVTAAFLSGMRWRTIVLLALLAALAIPIGWGFILKPYQKDRILTVIDPSRDPSGVGYQEKQSRIAIGSGGLTGKGIGAGTQSRLQFLPQQHTDFIFAFLAEEQGFLGAGAVLGLLAYLVLRTIQTALLARDRLGLHLAALVAVLIAGQAIINMGMVLGVLPTIGVPLPLVSYGIVRGDDDGAWPRRQRARGLN
jgi:rod shape determining protein RodA